MSMRSHFIIYANFIITTSNANLKMCSLCIENNEIHRPNSIPHREHIFNMKESSGKKGSIDIETKRWFSISFFLYNWVSTWTRRKSWPSHNHQEYGEDEILSETKFEKSYFIWWFDELSQRKVSYVYSCANHLINFAETVLRVKSFGLINVDQLRAKWFSCNWTCPRKHYKCKKLRRFRIRLLGYELKQTEEWSPLRRSESEMSFSFLSFPCLNFGTTRHWRKQVQRNIFLFTYPEEHLSLSCWALSKQVRIE